MSSLDLFGAKRDAGHAPFWNISNYIHTLAAFGTSISASYMGLLTTIS